MPIEKTYEAQMIVMATVDLAGEMRAWARKVPELSLSNLMRASLNRGWPKVRTKLRAEHGELTAQELWAGKRDSVKLDQRAAWIEANPCPLSALPRP
jgi:hypothetical protein